MTATTNEEHKEGDVNEITSWETIKEITPLLVSQHTFAQSSAGSKDRIYYLKKYTTIFSSIMFLLLVGMGTFLISWNRPTSTTTTTDVTTATTTTTTMSTEETTVPAVVLPMTTSASINAFFSDTTVTAPTQMPAISEYRGYVAPPVVIAAQPPATASYKSSKPTLIPWELQKIHPTYVPSRIPTFTFEFIDGGLAYGAAQADGYHPEAMPGYHEFGRRTTRRRTSQQQSQQPQQQTEVLDEEKTEVTKPEEKIVAEVIDVEKSHNDT